VTALIGGKSCRTCRYSHRQAGADGVFCTRYPPQVIVVPTPQGMALNSAYPTCNPDVPCGEYLRSDALAAAEVGALGRA
jgi:hypothetical protein